MKLTLFHLHIKAILKQSLEYGSNVALVILQGTGKNKNVVQVNNNKLMEEVPQDIIY